MWLRNVAVVTAFAVGAPAVVMAEPTPSSADAASYAEREQQDPHAADFEGGDMMVAGISGGLIVVLLFMLAIVT